MAQSLFVILKVGHMLGLMYWDRLRQGPIEVPHTPTPSPLLAALDIRNLLAGVLRYSFTAPESEEKVSSSDSEEPLMDVPPRPVGESVAMVALRLSTQALDVTRRTRLLLLERFIQECLVGGAGGPRSVRLGSLVECVCLLRPQEAPEQY
jgi:hypothetical protein